MRRVCRRNGQLRIRDQYQNNSCDGVCLQASCISLALLTRIITPIKP
ncbi:hypothetical protein M2392_002627 [Pseudomonas grimontii]|jgi:hypothetical protein|nr:hypothetical protein [Pseudomonas grimontii]